MTTTHTTAQMATAARALLEALTTGQRHDVQGELDGPDFREWCYLPGDRAGVRLGDLDAEQRDLALALLDTGCSPDGAVIARGIIELDMIRRQLASDPDPDDHRFWIRIFGTVSETEPWAWRVNGHHLSVHVTVIGDTYATTPNFFGAEPALVTAGPRAGLRSLLEEEELARALLTDLTPAQRQVAIRSGVAPDDIVTRFDPVADPDLLPAGLTHGDLTASQRGQLERVVRRYFDRAPIEHADLCWQAAVRAGLDQVTFSWAGSEERGEGHYYAVQGPTFLLEYDNTQDDANHIHSVWRDLTNDWGGDLLRRHYAEGHSRPEPVEGP